MFNTAIGWIEDEPDREQRQLLINLTCACGLMYEKAFRGGNITGFALHI
jgi:hypothetical protein